MGKREKETALSELREAYENTYSPFRSGWDRSTESADKILDIVIKALEAGARATDLKPLTAPSYREQLQRKKINELRDP